MQYHYPPTTGDQGPLSLPMNKKNFIMDKNATLSLNRDFLWENDITPTSGL